MHYADQFSTLPLLQQLRSSKGRDEVSSAEVELLVAMVLNAAEIIGPLLDRIPLTFRQYTQHDLRHSANAIKLMGKFIPARTQKRLNAVELAVLALSALVHDAGMFVTDGEKEEVVASAEYRRYEAGQGERTALLENARAAGEHLRASALQDALLAEYFRRVHPQRAGEVVARHLKDKLVFRETDLIPVVQRVAESHGWGVLESNDPRDPEKSVNRLSTRRPVSSVPVNEQYLACCLRLADIMDFDRSRTPVSVFQHLGFTEAKSWAEWNKHLQVTGWHVDEHEVMYSIPCSHPAFYVAVMEFLDWIDTELRDCSYLIREAPKSAAERYTLNLPSVVDRRQVEMADKSYVAGAFRFQLDYERIMHLLLDKSLYPDPSLFLRELLQNALDACRTRMAHAQAAGRSPMYVPQIQVWDHSDREDNPQIIFQDNGIGMSRHIVENFFMRVGRSYYRSPDFLIERQRLLDVGVELEATSQFGIGILSCFMVADRFEVETYRAGNRPLRIEVEGPTKYFTIQLLTEPDRVDFGHSASDSWCESPPRGSGTRITVHLRSRSELGALDVLTTHAVNTDCEIAVFSGSELSKAIIPAARWSTPALTLRNYPQVLGPLTVREIDLIADSLESVLVAVPIPTSKYTFSRHLGGASWLWLLRDSNGHLRPQSSYLSISSTLKCVGLPALLGGLTKDLSPQTIGELCSQLEDMPGIARRRQLPRMLSNESNVPRWAWERIAAEWPSLTVDERQVFSTALRAGNRTALPWYATSGLPLALASGSLNWVGTPARLDDFLQLSHEPRSIALYGILVPAGFVKWNPLKGTSQTLDLSSLPGGTLLDIRGSATLQPAASRLFIDYAESAKAGVPFTRAMIRLVGELTNQSPTTTREADWRSWLDAFFRRLLGGPFGPEALLLEAETVSGYSLLHDALDRAKASRLS